jgi:tetratricopeptide (TPR) repeat protein
MKKIVIAVLLCLFILPPVSGADDFYESELDHGITNSTAYSYLLIAQSREHRAQAGELLNKARVYSPDLPAVYFALSKASFSLSGGGLLKSVDYIVQGVAAYSRNFWWTFTLTTSLFFSLVLSFLLAVVITVAIRLFYDIPLLSHDLAEGNLHPVVLAVFFLISLFGPLLLLAGLLVLLGLYMKKTDRAVMYLFLVFLLCSPLIVNTAARFISAFSSGNVRSVVMVNDSQDNKYAMAALKNDTEFAPLFSYALALKRDGRYEEAIAAFERLLGKRQDPRVYVDLGNCYVGLGLNDQQHGRDYLEEAMGKYRAAIHIRPLASAYYNLSEISRETLDFAKGDEYFRSAVSLDRAAVSGYRALYSRNPNRLVADETLPSDSLWEYIWGRPFRAMTFGMTRIPPAVLSVLALCLLALFYFMDKQLPRRAYRCRKCGVILCTKCEKGLLWGQMCPRCYGSLIKLDEFDAKERVARILSIYARQRRRRTILKILSFILPGSPQIFAGKTFKGFFFLWPFLFFLVVPVTDSIFVPNNALVSHGFFSWAALYLAVVVYFVSNVITRQRISRGWL